MQLLLKKIIYKHVVLQEIVSINKYNFLYTLPVQKTVYKPFLISLNKWLYNISCTHLLPKQFILLTNVYKQ